MTAMIDGDYAMDIIRYAILGYALYHCTIFLDHGWMDGWMNGGQVSFGRVVHGYGMVG
jgi:hypothetical protein